MWRPRQTVQCTVSAYACACECACTAMLHHCTGCTELQQTAGTLHLVLHMYRVRICACVQHYAAVAQHCNSTALPGQNTVACRTMVNPPGCVVRTDHANCTAQPWHPKHPTAGTPHLVQCTVCACACVCACARACACTAKLHHCTGCNAEHRLGECRSGKKLGPSLGRH